MDYREFKAEWVKANPGLSPGQRSVRCRKAWEAQASAGEKKSEAKRQKENAAAKAEARAA